MGIRVHQFLESQVTMTVLIHRDNCVLPQKNYTPTEQRVIDWLSDGYRHRFEEYLGLDYDPSERKALIAQIGNIRRKLEGTGFGVICEARGRIRYYRIVRFISQD